ncbi:Protein BZZ1 [Exophiala dermatitidis]|uniref:High osmolarity signaling protein SHO1 n=1 Tax=Exophiala dermatitidis (strain ATCC 34100 / CBS 525.76 / NIH/UT8656) TaxID=858893 RepID=H6CAY6_EXODN|nr:protein-tyrosine kinase [Exophiala dermatitidis NIH/UT8656]EHY60933.1 protein-tyrosine kinase [Exophiala dermatitidis NIH/UT8656]
MAQVPAVSFGAELKDGYKPVDNWVSLGITWLTEIQEFYEERAAIEKEYSQKLTALAKKYYDKKAKKSSNLSVGDNPALTPGSLESASLTTWTTQLSTLEARANEHGKFGQDLISQVATPLEYNARKLEDLRKSHAEYQLKLLKERDSSYGELKKLKAKYDTVCQEVENRRRKTESSFDKSKAQSTYIQQLAEMNNVKNTYLIGINVTNKLKECYYHEYVPELLDSLQDLNETRVAKLNNLWLVASTLETNTLKRSTEHMSHLSAEIPRNDPKLDSNMFVRHNAVQWQEPPNMVFEPSPVWLDSDNMVTDETAKIFLRNILQKSKPLVSQLKAASAQKRKELENVKKVRENIRAGKDRRDEVDCVRSQFAVQEDLHAIDRNRLTAEVEVSTITSVVGDLSMYGKSHTFKSETFKMPTNCDLCGDRIWGLSAKGFICTDCGFTCHSKCHMKVPADCPGEQTKEEKKKLKAERQAAATAAAEAPASNGVSSPPSLTRQDTMSSLSSGYAASATRSVSGNIPRSMGQEDGATSGGASLTANAGSTVSSSARRNRIVAPPPTTYVSAPTDSGANGSSQPRAKMLYPYEARDDGEVTLSEGTEVRILEPDDGGWTKVDAGFGNEGLVPTAYLEELPAAASIPAHARTASLASTSTTSLASSNTTGKKKQGPAVAPKRGAKKLKYVEALYPYTAQSDAEFDMVEGERFVLISMGTGDGWAEVEKNGETRAVPANYIQEV